MEGRYEELFIKKDSSSTERPSHLFVDNAVYSRNRCFRLALSSKAGKTSVLLPTGRHACTKMVCFFLLEHQILSSSYLYYFLGDIKLYNEGWVHRQSIPNVTLTGSCPFQIPILSLLDFLWYPGYQLLVSTWNWGKKNDIVKFLVY